MRIVGGLHKGRRLNPPASLPIRPTTDRAREGIFNILVHRLDFDGLRVLDLFAGSGGMGLEFASRGCPEVTAVDQHAGCIGFIRKMADELDLPVKTIRAEVFSFLKKGNRSETYDLVFADPPYHFPKDKLEELIKWVGEGGWISEDGVMIIEHPVQYDLTGHERFHSGRDYGSSRFSFLGEL